MPTNLIPFPLLPQFPEVARRKSGQVISVREETRCEQFVILPGDLTGENAIPCNRPSDFICKYCGAICLSCRTEFSCAETGGPHTRANGPEVA